MGEKKVVIVGGGGYFGQHVAKRFQRENFHTVILDLDMQPQETVELDPELTTFLKGSILDEKTVEDAMVGCVGCVHMAAYGSTGWQGLDKKMCYNVNVGGTRRVLRCARAKKVKCLVYTSSISVIFVDKELDMADEETEYPDERTYYSPYAETKATGEKFVRSADDEDFTTVSLRLRGVYAPGEPRSTDRAADLIYRGFYAFRCDKKPPTLTQYSGLDNTCDAIWLAFKAAFEKPASVGGKVYHIVDDGVVDSTGFWNPLIEALGQTPPRMSIPFWLLYAFAYICEMLSKKFEVTFPLNRLEANLLAISNTYSIEAAKRDFGYDPKNNHDLTKVIKYYTKKYEKNPVWRLKSNFFEQALVLGALATTFILWNVYFYFFFYF